jgi:hypothetical protein
MESDDSSAAVRGCVVLILVLLTRVPACRGDGCANAFQSNDLEVRLNNKLADHDKAIAAILSAIRQVMNLPAPTRRGIGHS